MNISQTKQKIIEKLKQSDTPMNRFDLMMTVLEPELRTFRVALAEFINAGDIEVTIDWQVKLSKILKNNDK